MDCNGCTLCCYALDVPQYESPSGEYCKHCNQNVGCTIHKTRKDVCKDFGCLYWHEKELPEYLNPKNLGIMIEVLGQVWGGYVDPIEPNKWRNIHTKTLFKKINDSGHPIIVSDQGIIKFFLPEGSSWTKESAMNEMIKTNEGNNI